MKPVSSERGGLGSLCPPTAPLALLLTVLAMARHPREVRRMWRDLS